MKNKFLVSCSILIGLLLGYLIFYTFYYINFDHLNKISFSSKQRLNVIKKYYNILNHVRPEYVKSTELVFSEINSFNNNKKILMQGDSWFEQINYPLNDDAKNHHDIHNFTLSDGDHKSLNYIKKWSQSKNIGVINAGTSSYSPSLMTVQLDVLEKDFNIYPNIIVAYIDQTDINDENCRYRHNKVYKDNKLLSVGGTTTLDRIAFNYQRIIEISDIKYSSKKKYLKVFDFANSEIIFRLNKFFVRNFYKISNIFRNEKIEKCSVYKKFTNKNLNEISYFKSSLKEYLNKAINKKTLDKIYLVSFPHLRNMKEIYEGTQQNIIDVSDLIHEVLNSDKEIYSKKVEHINFSKLVKEKRDLFAYDDFLFDKIHLKKDAHKLFIGEIINRIDKS